MVYNPALDGLRAVAVILVLAFHARVPGLNGGFLGVDVFFVLSGYLITRLLAQEHSQTGTIGLPAFWARRAVRLYPALATMLVCYVLAAPLAWPEHGRHMQDASLAFLQVSNYSYAHTQDPRYVAHAWSLATEWQFYLLWPLAFLAASKLAPKRRLALVVTLAVLATAWRWHILSADGFHDAYYRFDTRLSGLLVGAALALAQLRSSRAMPWAGALLLLFALCVSAFKLGGSLRYGMLSAELGTALLITSCDRLAPLATPALAWLGRMSYGIYLWHYPIMRWMRGENFDPLLIFMAGGATAIILAAASYYTIERLAKRALLRNRVESTRVAQVGALGRDPRVG